jgi:AraC-like DNA-binding protein
MQHRYEIPHKQLTEYVRTILIIEGFSESGSNKLPVFTNGMSVLFCKTERGDTYEKIDQLTIYSKPPSDIWTVNEQSTIVAYFFRPFVVSSLFNISAGKLSEEPLDLSTWNPQINLALKTQIADAMETSRKIEVLDNLLLQQLHHNQQTCSIIQYATDQMMANPGKEIIAELLKTLNLNERTFQRVFKKHVGISPTHYRRICQFQQSFGQLREKQFNKISEVAYDNDFADQSHFIRSFREFTQITPKDYLKTGLKNKKE